jgi:hypothetical protein
MDDPDVHDSESILGIEGAEVDPRHRRWFLRARECASIFAGSAYR